MFTVEMCCRMDGVLRARRSHLRDRTPLNSNPTHVTPKRLHEATRDKQEANN